MNLNCKIMVENSNKSVSKTQSWEKSRIQISFRRFVTFQNNNKDIREMLGVDVFTVREWVESNFLPEMNWNNYGKVWVIDHIVPLRFFNIFDGVDMKLCWHYKNLMPLYTKDNQKKSGNVFFAFELLHELKDKDHYFMQLYLKVKVEVEWMSTYIDNFHKKYNV